MNELPNFSCICPTYGRPALLEEAIACFVTQNYGGESELVVFNTCPEQELILPNGFDPRVLLVNCKKRPTSLGASRNLAVAMSEGTHLVVWDDDDGYLPNHLSNFAKGFESPDVHWVWQTAQFYALKWKIQSVTGGGQNVVAFTRQAWLDVGCYADLNCGEDRDFVGRLTKKFSGKRLNLDVADISFCYNWDNGAYHVSGEGDDAHQKTNAWRRSEMDFHRRVRHGAEKTGRIELHPRLRHNYVQMAKSYVDKLNRQLGRT